MTREEYKRNRAYRRRKIDAYLAAKKREAVRRAICIYAVIAAGFGGTLIAIFTGHL